MPMPARRLHSPSPLANVHVNAKGAFHIAGDVGEAARKGAWKRHSPADQSRSGGAD